MIDLSSPPEKPVEWAVYPKTGPYTPVFVTSRTWFHARELGESEFRRRGEGFARDELEAVIQSVGCCGKGPTK